MRRQLAAVVAIPLVVFAAISADRAQAVTAEPMVEPVPGLLQPGQVVGVSGVNWPAGQSVSAAICGNNAASGSSDCDLPGSVSFLTTQDGRLSARLAVSIPPSPCPCVVLVTGPGGGAQTPVNIAGATEAPVAGSAEPVRPQATSTLRVDQAVVTGAGGVEGAFGGSVERLLRLRVTNTGDSVVKAPYLSVRVGRSSSGGVTAEAPTVGPIGPGETAVIEVPFTIDAPAYGTYTVSGDIGVVGNRIAYAASTSNNPWGLVVSAVVLLQLLVVWIVRRNRRLRLAREAELEAAPLRDAASLDAATGGPDDPELPANESSPGAAADLPEETAEFVAAAPGPESIDDAAGDGATATDHTIPPRGIGLDGPVIAAPWH